MSDAEFQQALIEWAQALGPEHVRHDNETLARYARSTLPRGTRPGAILYPASTKDVQEVVRIAARRGVGLYPISRGKNWGYGDACAVQDGQAIVDLGRMNRIVEVNPTLAYAVIEPGVTQKQMVDYLQERDLPLILDCSGAGPNASILGNVLERGFGHTPYGDHMQTTCSMEIVLADGRVLRTGFGHYDNAQSAYAFRYGIGPCMDGLFTQSNYGIVTRAGVWLLPRPERFNAFFFKVPNDEDIVPVIEALRPLKLQGVLQSAVHIGNDLRAVSGVRRYPWDLMRGETPLSDEVRAVMRRQCGVGAWNVGGGIYGTRKQVAAHRSAIRKALRGLASVYFVGGRLLTLGRLGVALLRKVGLGGKLESMLTAAGSVYDLLQGNPSEAFFNGALWRLKGEPRGLDPLDNNCGLLWLSPVIPMTGEAARALVRLVEPIYDRCRFEFMVTLTLITPRALCCVLSISYDRNDPAETQRAADCYSDLLDAVMRAGYVPYRAGIQSMPKLHQGSSVFWDVAGQIKQVLDPANIISPGRYVPVQPSPDSKIP